ncbi:MAG: hypothetical protein A4E62_02217 [Syntrophorhabdus sp. PtaU1.Bin002]|nr:MAG: hypothetical protein A4E62_02217 [Syntrophorhabdus sp. PtaU1.Bin002]
MQFFQNLLANRQLWVFFMNKIKRLPVAANLFFGTVMKKSIAKDDCADALVVHLNTLDAVGRDCALDEGMIF